MATWTTPIPPNDVVAGDPGHPGMHNQLSNNVTEIRANVDLNVELADPRMTAGAAGVATVRALGTTATTAAAGNDVRLMIGTAGEIPDSEAVTLPEMVADFNELLAELRARGILSAL
jgi:hypothetical protein